MNLNELSFTPSRKTIRVLQVLAVAGGVTLLAGGIAAPQRAWVSLLLASYFLTCLGLAGIFFVALQYACGAGWSVSFRRIPEAMSGVLPFAAAGIGAVLLFRPSLYPWTGQLAEPLEGFKGIWLNRPFFLGRATVYFALWILLARALVRNSRAQDRDGDLSHTRRNVRLSMVFILVFAVTFWLASFDWIMSLEPQWSSTIFGVYNFAGLFSAGLAMLILLAIWLRRKGPLRDFVNEEHLHDLGKLLFAFSTFWMYIWFSQYMLIWYANIPEETTYFIHRQHGYWGPLFLLDMLLNWAVPFVVLLPRGSKRSSGVMARVAMVVMFGRWLDLYLMIAPPLRGTTPAFGLWEAIPMLGAAGLFLLVFVREVRDAAPVPLRDPYLVESLHYHN